MTDMLAKLQHPTATVLIVDDSPENLVMLSESLRSRYQVKVVNSGDKALRVAGTDPRPDLILLDILMPVMDGFEVLDRLQADPTTRHIPVIIITALSQDQNELLGLRRGAVDYITKPFNPEIVMARVNTHLELKAARDYLAGENDRLDAEVNRRMQENVLIQELSIRALANLAEARDMETGRHILRTQAYVELLANHLADHPRFREALSGENKSLIIKGSPLHDIGKVGIPDPILLKPGRLNPAEYEIMKTHAMIGANAIGKAMQDTQNIADEKTAEVLPGAFAFMRVAQEIALTHHEHWDGHGYPLGLKGEDIPVSGRIMALADVYDALTSRRIYKRANSLDAAAQAITEQIGFQFDPDVVEAFLQLREQFEVVASRFKDA